MSWMKRAACTLLTAILLGACASAPRTGDWRTAVRTGDYPRAYAELYRSWREGTADVKAETLRHAWRDPSIVAQARADLARILATAARTGAGDPASFRRSVESGPMEDRVAFAKLLDRTIDLDREFAAAASGRPPVAASPNAASAPTPAPPARPTAVQPSPALSPAPIATPKAALPATARSPEGAATAPATPAPLATPAPMPPVTAASPAAPGSATAPPTPGGVTPPPRPVAMAPSEAPSRPAPGAPKSSDLPVRAPPPGEASIESVARARERAAWRCRGDVCDKAWVAAEAFVGANSDRRIRRVTSGFIDTYPPIVLGEVGLSVARVPVENGESELRITVHCRAGKVRNTCEGSALRIYSAFPEYLRTALSK